MQRARDRHVCHVDVDVVRHVRRVDLDVQLVQDFLEHAAIHADTVRNTDEHQGYLRRDLLAGHQLLKVDVQDVTLEGVALHLTNERADRPSIDAKFDDGTTRRDLAQQTVDGAGLQRERLRLTIVTVDDRGNAAVAAKRAGDALAGGVAKRGGQGGG